MCSHSGSLTYLDIALMAYAIYWLLKLVGTSKVESVGKVILLFLLALMLSGCVFRSTGYTSFESYSFPWRIGAHRTVPAGDPAPDRPARFEPLALIQSLCPYAKRSPRSNAIAQTVLACTEMSNSPHRRPHRFRARDGAG